MSEPINVTHVVLSLDVGGLERNVVNQIREGRRLGQDVSILCVERPGVLASRARDLGARVVCVDKAPGLRPSTVRRIRDALRELRPHVVHTHQIGPLLYTGLAARPLGIPLIVHTEHGKEAYASRARTRWLGRLAGRYVERFYCLTRELADCATASRIVPAEKVRLIMNGIDTALYKRSSVSMAARDALGIPHSAPLIGTVGRLDPVKRQEMLIAAFANLRKQLSDAHLLLVGDGPLRGSLEGVASALGVRDRVHFAGYQSDTTPYLHAMDVFALPSDTEGMPQALLEACVAAVPVIASCVGGIPDVIEHGVTGLLFEAGDAAGLEAGLSELLVNRTRAAGMAEVASRKVCSTFDVSRMAGDYHRDFLELLDSADRARASRRPLSVA